jgi:hypothetical protein
VLEIISYSRVLDRSLNHFIMPLPLISQFITTCEWEKSWKIGDNDREISSTINTRGYIACKKASRPCEGGLSSCCILWEMCRSLQCRATTTDAMGR